jgi:hypothetical protein
MGWVKPTASTTTWGAGTTATATFARTTIAPSPWATVSAQPEAPDGGIDFEMRFREYPTWYIRSERPVLLQSSLSEGAP